MAADRRIDQLLASPLGRQFALHLIDRRAEFTLSGLTAREATRAVSAAVASRASLPKRPAALLAALARESFGFGFSGDDEWIWPLSEAVKGALRPVADALVTAAEPLGWWKALDRADQRLVVWDDLPEIGEGRLEGLVHETAARERAANVEGLRRARPRRRPAVRIGARWWSAPAFAPLTWTTGAVPPLPATALLGFIDTYQPFEVTSARIFSVAIEPFARVYEVAEPEDWRRLVQRFPEDVTGTHDGEWRDWGGVAGPWLLPNWEEVMAHYDGVHVTVGGFVASCALALPVGNAYTMLAGWIPDATLWLNDVETDRRLLGRWHGQPTPELDTVIAAWEPA